MYVHADAFCDENLKVFIIFGGLNVNDYCGFSEVFQQTLFMLSVCFTCETAASLLQWKADGPTLKWLYYTTL